MDITANTDVPAMTAAAAFGHSSYLSSAYMTVRAAPAALSPLVLVDRLITLAQEADHAGYRSAPSPSADGSAPRLYGSGSMAAAGPRASGRHPRPPVSASTRPPAP